jgi:hypothetical protein
MASRAVLLTLLLTGCATTSGSSAKSASLECGVVLPSLFARSKAVASQVLAGQPVEWTKPFEEMIEAVTPVAVQSCRDDRWSKALLGCMDGMTVTDDPHKCNHLFTSDQAVGFARRMMAMMNERGILPHFAPDPAR